MPRKSPRETAPREVKIDLAAIAYLAGDLAKTATELYQIGFSKGPQAEVTGKSNTASDPTGELGTSSYAREQWRRMVSDVSEARECLNRAAARERSIVSRLDAYEDYRDPEGRYGRPPGPQLVSNKELRQAREAKERRERGIA